MSHAAAKMGLDELAPGVWGYTCDGEGGELLVPFIAAGHEGNGDVGRYLDALPRDRMVIFPNVLCHRLAGMLQRRGFREWLVTFGTEQVPSFVRERSSE